MQVETPSWFLSSWRRQDSVDWNLVRGNVWQFWKSWLLYAVQHHVYLARCYILPHWIWLQSRKNYLQIMRRQTPKWFFTATTQGKGTCRQKLYCVHLPEITTFLSSLPLSWIPTVLIVIMERGNWENDFGWIKS